MRDVVVFGASGLGAQIAFLIESINAVSEQWHILGYLDDDAGKHGADRYGYKVLGGAEWLATRTTAVAVAIGIGSPGVRNAVVEKLLACPQVSFPTLVHPSAIVCRTTVLEQGVLVCENVVIKTDVSIGAFALVNTSCVLGHDVVIERNASLMPSVNIAGAVTVGEGAFVGINATVLQGLRIGRNAVLGSSALASKDVPDGCTAVGVPARVVKSPPPAQD